MKIIIKILKHSQFSIELDSEKKTVQDLKNEIEKTQGFDVSQAKLLLNGKMLENSKLLQEYKIKEGNIIIVMNAKPKGNESTNPMIQQKKEPENKEEPIKNVVPEKKEEPDKEVPKKNEEFEKKEEQPKIQPINSNSDYEEKGNINITIKILKYSQFILNSACN